MRKHLSFANITAALALSVAISMTPAGAHVTSRFAHLWGTHIKPKIAKPGTINTSSNPVDWTKLKNVPSDIVDGDDDTPSAFSGYELITGTGVDISNAATGTASASCSTTDKEVLGGGFYSTQTVDIHASASYPFEPFTDFFTGTLVPGGWTATIRNNSGSTANLKAYAICADTDQTEA